MNDQAAKIAGELIKQLENAWNGADGQAFGTPYTEDAVFVTIRGDYLQSRAVITEGHQSIFNTIYKDSRITCVLLHARTLTDNVILAHARNDLSAPSGPLAGEHSTIATLVLVNKDRKWQIAGFHNTLVASTQ